MGAGILPICIFNSNLLFLFGKDRITNTWSDFGGKTENGESEFDTAIREGAEELNGFLGHGSKLANLVNSNNLLTINYDKYKIFVFLINFDQNLPHYFNNNNNFIVESLSLPCNNNFVVSNKSLKEYDSKHDGLFEKSEIKWFTYQDLKLNRDKFRLFYRPIIDIILKEYDNLLVKTNQVKY